MGPTVGAPGIRAAHGAVRHFGQLRLIFILIGIIFVRRAVAGRALDLTGLSGIVPGGYLVSVWVPVAVDAVHCDGIAETAAR